MRSLRCLALVGFGVLTSTGAYAQSFWDGFDNNKPNPSLWTSTLGKNGEPFGCKFYPSLVTPGNGGTLALTLHNGACSQIMTYAQYRYGTIQTRLQYSNVPGTVASLFTYNSWYQNPGHPWTEIDVEFLPSYPDVLHTNIIYQANQNAAYQQWELYISLAPYNIDPTKGPVQVGFDWSSTKISWYVFDSSGKKRYLRTVTNSSATNCDCIPPYAWPSNAASIFANYWHGDNSNSNSVNYFPKTYNYASGSAVYDFIQYISQ